MEQPIASMGWVVIGLVLALGEISPSWKELENISIQSRRKFSLHSLTRWEKEAGNARCLNQIIYQVTFASKRQALFHPAGKEPKSSMYGSS